MGFKRIYFLDSHSSLSYHFYTIGDFNAGTEIF